MWGCGVSGCVELRRAEPLVHPPPHPLFARHLQVPKVNPRLARAMALAFNQRREPDVKTTPCRLQAAKDTIGLYAHAKGYRGVVIYGASQCTGRTDRELDGEKTYRRNTSWTWNRWHRCVTNRNDRTSYSNLICIFAVAVERSMTVHHVQYVETGVRGSIDVCAVRATFLAILYCSEQVYCNISTLSTSL